jgi:hypothetical protein
MKTTGFLLFASAFLTLAWLTSCSKLHSIEGNGNITFDTRNIPYFNKIKSTGNFWVYIIQDTLSKVVVEAEDNLQPYIETDVSTNSLVINIHDHSNLDNNYPIKVYVYTPDISSIELCGSGKIITDSIKSSALNIDLSGSGNINLTANCNNLKADVSGSGEITLAGTSNQADYNISGSGKIRAYPMTAVSCFADISGSGCMYVTVTDFLSVNISGSGKVYYLGSPSVTTHITGSGSVIHN